MVGAEVVLGFDRRQKGCDSLELEGSGQVGDAVWGALVASSGLLFSNSTGRWVVDQRERDAALSCGVLGLDREVQGLQADRTFRSVGTDIRSYNRDQGRLWSLAVETISKSCGRDRRSYPGWAMPTLQRVDR